MTDALKYILGFLIAILAYVWDRHIKENKETREAVDELETEFTEMQIEQRELSVKVDNLIKQVSDLETSLKAIWDKES